MVNRSKAKGTAAESSLVAYLRRRGWPFAERRTLSGVHDKGDVAGLYGIAGAVVVEVKNAKAVSLGAWLREAAVEQANAGAALGVVVNKPVGVGLDRPGDWHAHMTVRQLCDLLAAAGYRGNTPDPEGSPDRAAWRHGYSQGEVEQADLDGDVFRAPLRPAPGVYRPDQGQT